MIGQWESDSKIRVAKRILNSILDSLDKVENIELALRCYGHQSKVPPQDCNDTRLEVPFAKNNSAKIKNRILDIMPKGTTPIARSLEAAADDFPASSNSRNVIILISDGLEECTGDPCLISQKLQKKGIILKPFIIGIGKGDLTSLNCIGTYYDASNEQLFKNVLNVVINYVLNKTTCQVNLLDSKDQASETNVAYTLYDHFSGLPRYNYIHTMNNKGTPDTLVIDHMATYDLVVHSIPEVRRDSITLIAGKHNIIAINAAQGDLQLIVKDKDPYKGLNCIIRKAGDMKTIHVQNFGETTKYLLGNYDLEVLCIPRINIKNVDIKQSYTTKVEIPQPGVANFLFTAAGYGSIFLADSDNMKFVYRFKENTLQETIYLQPGEYKAVFRYKTSKETVYTIQRTFRVVSGLPVTIKM